MGEERALPGLRHGRHVLVLTGNTRAGKTTTCCRLAAAAAPRGWRVAGVVCPARFRDGVKVGIDATDLRSGESRLLAAPRHSPDPQSLALRESDRDGCRHAEWGERGVRGAGEPLPIAPARMDALILEEQEILRSTLRMTAEDLRMTGEGAQGGALQGWCVGALGYLFDEDVLAWANGTIASASPCDLLIVDELGPLEIEQGRGFVAAFDMLRRGDYRLAVVVVRPSLLDSFGARLGIPFDLRLIEGVHYLPADSDSELPAWFEEYIRG